MRLSVILAMMLASPLLAEDPPLAKILQNGNVAAKKRALAGLIPGPADEKQRPVIRKALKDKDRGVRQAAAVALAWAGENDPAVIDELINGMAEPWIPRYFSLPDDPLTARKALVKIGAKAVPAMIAVVEDKKHPARASAIWALGEIGRPAKEAVLVIEAAIREGDLPGLHHIIEAKYLIDGDAAFAVKHLSPLLDTKDGLNCGGANRVIARMGRDAKHALPALVAAMRKYKEREVCCDLVRLAPHFRKEVLTALRETLTDPDLAASASRAIRDLGEGGVPVELTELNKNPAMYNWMAVRVEMVLGDYTPGERWAFNIEATNPVNVQGSGTVDAKKGDRIAVTGIFRHQPPGERMIVEAVVEKLEPKKR